MKLQITPDGYKIDWGLFGPRADEDVLYRVEAIRYSYVIDPDMELYGTTKPELQVYWYPVTKRTPCGAWIEGRFVNLQANKRFACNTIEEAVESFVARRQRQIRILKKKLQYAEDDLNLTRPSAGFSLLPLER